MRYDSDYTFDPLCESNFWLADGHKIRKPTGRLPQNICIRPKTGPVSCCETCLNMAWPGMTYTTDETSSEMAYLHIYQHYANYMMKPFPVVQMAISATLGNNGNFVCQYQHLGVSMSMEYFKLVGPGQDVPFPQPTMVIRVDSFIDSSGQSRDWSNAGYICVKSVDWSCTTIEFKLDTDQQVYQYKPTFGPLTFDWPESLFMTGCPCDLAHEYPQFFGGIDTYPDDEWWGKNVGLP